MATRNSNIMSPQQASKEDRDKALQSALDNIQKTFGKGAVMRLGDDSAMLNIEAI